MHKCIITVAYRFCCSAAILFFLAGSVVPQGGPAVSGRWVWKDVAHKNKPQTQFTVVIYREGDVVRGVYSVDEFINGEWQGEDGNQTPFRGRVTSGRVQIELDPSATVPGYEQNVTYKAPADGRKPSVALLTFKGGTLLWHLVKGDRIESVPAKVVLHRERRLRSRRP
jgi:hypothetical protein